MAIKNYKSLSYTEVQSRGTSRDSGGEGKQKPTTSQSSNHSQSYIPNNTPKVVEPVRTQEKAEPHKGKGVAGDKWTQPLNPMGSPMGGPRVGPPRAAFPSSTQDNPRVVANSSPPKAGPTQENPRVVVAEHVSGSPKRVEPNKDHGVPKDSWRTPLSPSSDHPKNARVEYSSPMKVQQMKDPGVTSKKLPSPLGPVAENPQTAEYGNNSPRKVEPRKDTGVTNDKWRKPLSTVADQSQAAKYSYGSPTKAQPTKDPATDPPQVAKYGYDSPRVDSMNGSGVTNNKWRKPVSSLIDPPQFAKYDHSSPKSVEPMKDHEVPNDKLQGTVCPATDSPRFATSGYDSPTKFEPMKDTGINNEKWDKPASPRIDHPQATNYRYSSSSTQVEPMKDSGVGNEKWRKHVGPAAEHPQATTYGYSPPTNVQPAKDSGFINAKQYRPQSPVRDPPQVAKYGYSTPAKVEPAMDKAFINEKWPKPLSPVRPQFTNYGHSSPMKDSRVMNDRWSRPLSPERLPQVAAYDYNSTTKFEPVKDNGFANERRPMPDSSLQEHPQVTVTKQGYIVHTRVELRREPEVTAEKWHTYTIMQDRQPEVKELIRFGPNENGSRPLGAANWRKVRNSIGHDRITAQEDDWRSSGHKSWSVPPSSRTPITSATNDIHKVTEILREAARSAVGSRVAVPASKYTYTDTIDSNEAQRRFGNLSVSPGPYKTEEEYIGTIDSKEAARRYNGAIV